jgi:protein-ribulosamine 3-kinase
LRNCPVCWPATHRHRPCCTATCGAATGSPPLRDRRFFDPAVYFGDREADLAMTRLFGGFGPRFYRAYEARAPLPAGAAARVDLYNLYHVLNHANLFGGGYARQARTLLDRLLAQSGH